MSDDTGILLLNSGVLDTRYLAQDQNLADLDNPATARTNLGLVSGGAGDIWVEKAGDTMAGALVITPTANATSILNVTTQAGTSVLNVDTTNARVGIGTTSPTAYLHLKASTASANTGALKFTAGVLATTPEAGLIEYDGTDWYLNVA